MIDVGEFETFRHYSILKKVYFSYLFYFEKAKRLYQNGNLLTT